MKKYYIYMLRCEDNSLYTGITNNLKKRLKEHFNKEKKCAKYTRSHQARTIEAVWETENKRFALKLEFHIKRLTKDKKEKLIKKENLKKFLDDKIDCDLYKKINKETINNLLK